MSAAVVQPPPPSAASAAGTRGASAPVRLELPPTPPLSVEEERALINQIQEARSLRRMRKRLVKAGGKDGEGPMMPPAVWAREASMDVKELKGRLQAGMEAKETLIERNIPMVLKIVQDQYRWRLHGGQVSTADLVQEGAFALGVAAEMFDPNRETRFLTYAVWIVRDKLDIALASGNTAISVPVSALKEYYRARKALATELGRRPSESEVSTFFVNEPFNNAAAADAGAASNVLPTTGLKILATIPERGLTKMETAAGMGAGGVERRALGTEDAAMARMRKRRLDLLAAVQRVTSLDSSITSANGDTVPLVEAVEGFGGSLQGDPLRAAEDRRLSSLLPKVLTPRQAELVRMACGLVDGRPRSMQECAETLCLSVARTRELFDASLQKLRLIVTLDRISMV